jgi:hypothetical protein
VTGCERSHGRRDGERLTNDSIREVASKLLFEKCRRGFEPAQVAGLHEHDRSLNADAGMRDPLPTKKAESCANSNIIVKIMNLRTGRYTATVREESSRATSCCQSTVNTGYVLD